MELGHVVHRIAVGHHKPLEAPVATYAAVDQPVGGARRRAVQRVVRTHHRAGLSFDDGSAEGRRIGRFHIAWRHIDIESMPARLGPAVHGEVLGRGDRARVVEVLALQAVDKAHCHLSGEERVFAVRFHATAPARVAEDIDVGRPDGETGVALVVVARATGLVELGARFGRDHRAHLLHEMGIPARRQANGLWKHRGITVAGDAVQALAPPLIGGDAQARNCRRIVHGLRHFSSRLMCATRSAARCSGVASVFLRTLPVQR